MTKKEERVWTYLLANRKATSSEVAEAVGVSIKYVDKMIATISSPNWREEVPVPKFIKDDNAKTRYDLLPPELLEETAKSSYVWRTEVQRTQLGARCILE